MPGPTHPWDHEDPRESTVDLPRVGSSGPAAAPSGPVGGLSPGRQPRPAAHAPAPTPAVAAAQQEAVAAPAPPAPLTPSAVAPSRADPASLPQADRTRPELGAAPTGRQSAGSLADLRSRLARLPAGHPSSPYDDGGTARPLPIRLNQLELGLPAPEREHPSPELPANLPSRGPGPVQAQAGMPELAADPSPSVTSRAQAGMPELAADPSPSVTSRRQAGPASPHPAAGGADAADSADARDGRPGADPRTSVRPGSPPADLSRAAPRANGNGHSDTGRRARPQWQDPYATPSPSNGHSRHDRPGGHADLTLGPWTPGPVSAAGSNGGSHPPELNGRTESPGRPGVSARPEPPPLPELAPLPDLPALPDPAASRDLPAPRDLAAPRDLPDLPDSQVTAGAVRAGDSDADRGTFAGAGASHQRDEIRDLTEHVMAAHKAAEGRGLHGGYGSSGLTPAIRRIAAQLPYGGLASGSEATSLKSGDRFAAKLARLIARNPGRPAEDLAWSIYDAIRYAFEFEPADYTDGTWLVHRKLKTQGFELEARRNRWESPEYKGIWTRWRDPAHGLAFEVQFHTTDSWAVIQRTHEAYVRITDPATPAGDRARLRARQVSAAVDAKMPPRCLEIDDFRADAR